MLFKNLIAAVRSGASGGAGKTADIEYPLETEAKLNRVHALAPVDLHLRILFQNERIGDENFADLYSRCLKETGTAVTPFNIFQRFQTRLNLVQYFLATLPVSGARTECGAYASSVQIGWWSEPCASLSIQARLTLPASALLTKQKSMRSA